MVCTYPLLPHVHTHSQGSKRHFNRPSTFFSAMAPRVLMGGDASSQDGTQQDSSEEEEEDDDSLSDLLDGPSDDVDEGISLVKVTPWECWDTLYYHMYLPPSPPSLPLPSLPSHPPPPSPSFLSKVCQLW